MEEINPVIKIGDIYWMTRNLTVNKFRNGDVIQEVFTSEEWKEALEKKLPVFKKHPNKTLQNTFGYYYNYYAILDKRNLAPKGFEIACNYYWDDLIDELGGSDVAGNKMKSKFGWKDSLNLIFYKNKGTGSNESGFSAIASGNVSNSGSIRDEKEQALWLALGYAFNSEMKIWHGAVYSLNYKNNKVSKWSGNPDVFGFNIRCVVENQF